MRLLFATILTGLALPAQAHIGHLGEVAGHGHWLGAAAAGAAIAIGLWAGLRGRQKPDAEAADAEDAPSVEGDEELQEA